MSKNELLDVFPNRPNQKVAEKAELLQTGRSTRSSNKTSLFAYCTYANKVISYEAPKCPPKVRASYSPEPIQRYHQHAESLANVAPKAKVPLKPQPTPKVAPKRPRNASKARGPAAKSLKSAKITAVSSSASPNDALTVTKAEVLSQLPAKNLDSISDTQEIHSTAPVKIADASGVQNAVKPKPKVNVKLRKSVAEIRNASPSVKLSTGMPVQKATLNATAKDLPSVIPTPPRSKEATPVYEENDELSKNPPSSVKLERDQIMTEPTALVSGTPPATPVPLQVPAFPPKESIRKRATMKAVAPSKPMKKMSSPRKTGKPTGASKRMSCQQSKLIKNNVNFAKKRSLPGPNHRPKPLQPVMINPVFTSSGSSCSSNVFVPKYARDDATVMAELEKKKKTELEKKKAVTPPQEAINLPVEHVQEMYENLNPVRVLGRIAVEYENFDLSAICRLLKNLPVYEDRHEHLLLPILKLGDWDVISKLDESTAEFFYKHEFLPAVENFKSFQRSPAEFHDVNRGKYESYSENGLIVEHPLPAKPEIFPSQIRNRLVAKLQEEHDRRNEYVSLERQDAEIRAIQEEVAARQEEQNQFHNQFHAQMMMFQNLDQFTAQQSVDLGAYLLQMTQQQLHYQQPMYHDPNVQNYYPYMNFQQQPNYLDPEFLNSQNMMHANIPQ